MTPGMFFLGDDKNNSSGIINIQWNSGIEADLVG